MHVFHTPRKPLTSPFRLLPPDSHPFHPILYYRAPQPQKPTPSVSPRGRAVPKSPTRRAAALRGHMRVRPTSGGRITIAVSHHNWSLWVRQRLKRFLRRRLPQLKTVAYGPAYLSSAGTGVQPGALQA